MPADLSPENVSLLKVSRPGDIGPFVLPGQEIALEINSAADDLPSCENSLAQKGQLPTLPPPKKAKGPIPKAP